MKYWIVSAVLLLAALGLALSGINEYVFFAGYVVLTFVVLATAWNVLGGYAGYVNFGTPAFFGLGAYSAAVLFKALGAPLVLQIAAGALMGGLLGFGVGLLTLRLRGIFFAMGRGVAPETKLGAVSSLDVAPTVARLLGIEPPRDAEGRAIEALIPPAADVRP